MKVLLHACCGPCSLEPTRLFLEEGVDFAVDYTNPNIHPKEEYERRKEALIEYSLKPQGLDLIEGAYDVDAWEQQAGIYGTADRKARCRACYRLRFEQVAQHALEGGFDTICTTLTISPYQYTDIILEELERAAKTYGLKAEARDFSWCYDEATRRSIENGMYRQNYCGCRFSIAEAAAEREQRKRDIKLRKRLRRFERELADRCLEHKLRNQAEEHVSGSLALEITLADFKKLLGTDIADVHEALELIKNNRRLFEAEFSNVAFKAGEQPDAFVACIPQKDFAALCEAAPDSQFLADLIAFLQNNPHATCDEVVSFFAKRSRKYEASAGSEGLSIAFKNPDIDHHRFRFTFGPAQTTFIRTL